MYECVCACECVAFSDSHPAVCVSVCVCVCVAFSASHPAVCVSVCMCVCVCVMSVYTRNVSCAKYTLSYSHTNHKNDSYVTPTTTINRNWGKKSNLCLKKPGAIELLST